MKLHWIGLAAALFAAPLAAQDFRVTAESLAALSKQRPADRTVTLVAADRTTETLREIDVYAHDARVVVVDASGPREIARSDWRHFVPLASADGSARVTVSIAPDGSAATGTFFADDGEIYPLRSRREKSGDITFVRGEIDRSDAFVCGNSAPFESAKGWRDLTKSLAAVPGVPASRAKAGSRTATVAVDTDFELLNTKFALNTVNATNYIAALFAAMNVIYERDLDLTLLVGTTFLRTAAADPYPSTNATGQTDQLDEFGEFWRTSPTTTTVNRAFAMLLSGKGGSGASGIAWVNDGSPNYCTLKGFTFGGNGVCSDGTCTAGHYSVNRVSLSTSNNGNSSSFDVRITAHELGHNFGLSHTHCTDATTGAADTPNNTIDQCNSGEGGCYAGATTCPAPSTVNGIANVRGTLMSYCHLLGGCSAGLVFADRNRATLLPAVTANVTAGCFSAAPGQPPVIFVNGFE